MLLDTIEDGKLSRSERRALSEVLADLALDEDRRAWMRNRAFEVARKAAEHAPAAEVLEWLEEVIKLVSRAGAASVAKRADAHFSPGEGCRDAIVELYRRASRSADACIFTITDDRIAEAILAAHRRGVAVRIVADDDKAFDLGSVVERLGAAGIPVRVDRTDAHMHNKFAVFDGDLLLTGSYNWTRSAADANFENLIITDETRLVSAFVRQFDELWRRLS